MLDLQHLRMLDLQLYFCWTYSFRSAGPTALHLLDLQLYICWTYSITSIGLTDITKYAGLTSAHLLAYSYASAGPTDLNLFFVDLHMWPYTSVHLDVQVSSAGLTSVHLLGLQAVHCTTVDQLVLCIYYKRSKEWAKTQSWWTVCTVHRKEFFEIVCR